MPIESERDLPRKDLSLLVLATLAESPKHGYAIVQAIHTKSENLLRLREGTLYPILRILEQDGFVTGEWETEGRGAARRVYTLTQAGNVELQARIVSWRTQKAIVETLLGQNAPVIPIKGE
jgi:PadR family transcriptional regulator, regulatory protein PadR